MSSPADRGTQSNSAGAKSDEDINRDEGESRDLANLSASTECADAKFFLAFASRQCR